MDEYPQLFRLFQQNCDHTWEYDDNWKLQLRFKHESLDIPQHCVICGLESYEGWSVACVLERETGEVLEYP